jgi:hypothetical protein
MGIIRRCQYSLLMPLQLNPVSSSVLALVPLGRQLQKALEPKSSIILHVRASPATCIERIIQKDFSSTPYPPFSEALPDTITRCPSEFEAGDLETLWKSSAFWIFSVDGESTATERMVADLPLYNSVHFRWCAVH